MAARRSHRKAKSSGGLDTSIALALGMAMGRAYRSTKPFGGLGDFIVSAIGSTVLAVSFVLVIILSIAPKLGALLIGGSIAGIIYLRHLQKQKQAEEQEQLGRRLIELIDQHESALISYYHQSRRQDLFGDWDESRWHEHIDRFLKSQVVPQEPDFIAWRQTPVGQKAANTVAKITAKKVACRKEENPLALIDATALTPIDYERYCADLLREKGWNVHQTPATRDGGADFVAEKDGIRLVAQCKRYSQPVGNKAVQEATSAVRLYSGNVACVVAPMGFTRQAQHEATGLSVHLLHHSMLPDFADKLSG